MSTHCPKGDPKIQICYEIAFWERRKVPVMCLQIWGSPLSSPRIKLGPDIQTCYKVVSGGRAYSTLSFHDKVDTGSLWKQANSSTTVFYFQSCHYNHLYNKGFWANWGTIKNYGKNIKPPQSLQHQPLLEISSQLVSSSAITLNDKGTSTSYCLVVIVTATKYNKWSGIDISEIRGAGPIISGLFIFTSFSSACYICFLVNAFNKSKKNVCFPFVEDIIDDDFFMFWLGGDGIIGSDFG